MCSPLNARRIILEPIKRMSKNKAVPKPNGNVVVSTHQRSSLDEEVEFDDNAQSLANILSSNQQQPTSNITSIFQLFKDAKWKSAEYTTTKKPSRMLNNWIQKHIGDLEIVIACSSLLICVAADDELVRVVDRLYTYSQSECNDKYFIKTHVINQLNRFVGLHICEPATATNTGTQVAVLVTLSILKNIMNSNEAFIVARELQIVRIYSGYISGILGLERTRSDKTLNLVLRILRNLCSSQTTRPSFQAPVTEEGTGKILGTPLQHISSVTSHVFNTGNPAETALILLRILSRLCSLPEFPLLLLPRLLQLASGFTWVLHRNSK